jgi:ribosomal protein L37E
MTRHPACAKDEWKCNFGSFKQQHVETDEKKDAKQHHDHHKAAVAQKKSQVVVRANLKQLEPNHKKHNNNNNHKSNHSKKNHKKVPAVLKINDDDEDLMLGDGSAEDGEIILPSPISPGGAGMGTRRKIQHLLSRKCGLKIMAPIFDLILQRCTGARCWFRSRTMRSWATETAAILVKWRTVSTLPLIIFTCTYPALRRPMSKHSSKYSTWRIRFFIWDFFKGLFSLFKTDKSTTVDQSQFRYRIARF